MTKINSLTVLTNITLLLILVCQAFPVEVKAVTREHSGSYYEEQMVTNGAATIQMANLSCQELSSLGNAVGKVLNEERKSDQIRKVVLARAQELAGEAEDVGGLFSGFLGFFKRILSFLPWIEFQPPENVVTLSIDSQIAILAIGMTAGQWLQSLGPAGQIGAAILTVLTQGAKWAGKEKAIRDALGDIGYFRVTKPGVGTMDVIYDKQVKEACVNIHLEDLEEELMADYGWQDEHLYMYIPFDGEPPNLKKTGERFDYQVVLKAESVQMVTSLQPSETVLAFFQALKEERYSDAEKYIAVENRARYLEELSGELGGFYSSLADAFREMPREWVPLRVDIMSEEIQGEDAEVKCNLYTYGGDMEEGITINLIKENNIWKILIYPKEEVTTPAPGPAPTPAVVSRIAFDSNRDGDYEIYTMNPDGSEVVRLTFIPGHDHNADWSPDGNKVVFEHLGKEVLEVHIINADGSGHEVLVPHPGFSYYPTWSPDGTKIVFLSLKNDFFQIFTMNADGEEVRQLTDVSYDIIDLDWSPDGEKIAFSGWKVDDKSGIFVMDQDGTNVTCLVDTRADLDGYPYDLSWSLDGSMIAFLLRNVFNSVVEIYTVDVDSLEVTRLLTDFNIVSCGLTWSPDGEQIAFSSRRDGNGEIYVMDADGTDPTRVTYNDAEDLRPAWSKEVVSQPQAAKQLEYPRTPEEVVEAYWAAVIEGRDEDAKKYMSSRFLGMLEEELAKKEGITIKQVYEAVIEAEEGISKTIVGVEITGVRVWVPDEEVDVDYKVYFRDGTYFSFDIRLIKETDVWKVY